MIRLKGVTYEDFVNYKEPSMFLITPYCTFKCDKECGCKVCQNSTLTNAPVIEVNEDTLVDRFIKNPITRAVVIGGLEPLDTFEEVVSFIFALREATDATVVIYTGYNEGEVEEKINVLRLFGNIIIKFGRFIPNQPSHFDEVLGVNLASPNQYAKRLS